MKTVEEKVRLPGWVWLTFAAAAVFILLGVGILLWAVYDQLNKPPPNCHVGNPDCPNKDKPPGG